MLVKYIHFNYDHPVYNHVKDKVYNFLLKKKIHTFMLVTVFCHIHKSKQNMKTLYCKIHFEILIKRQKIRYITLHSPWKYSTHVLLFIGAAIYNLKVYKWKILKRRLPARFKIYWKLLRDLQIWIDKNKRYCNIN